VGFCAWAAKAPVGANLSDVDLTLDSEVAFAIRVSDRVFNALLRKRSGVFPQRVEPIFSSQILAKSGNLIAPGMNTDQFAGAMDSIRDVAGRYANEDQLQTVASFRQQQASQPSRNVVPSGATPGRDANGVIVGYKAMDGKVVRF